jgi:NTP pyrophosphatase (non-canonical NTP hydrolase)
LDFRDARDWAQFHRPKELAAALAIEAAELQELFLWREGEAAAEIRCDRARMAAIQHEVADVATFLLLLVHELELDLPRAIAKKVKANESRYPVAEHRGVARKSTHTTR